MLPNGDIILEFVANSTVPLTDPSVASIPCMIREIDLAGNTVRQVSIAQINTALAANGFAGLVLLRSTTTLPVTQWPCACHGQHTKERGSNRSNDANPGSWRRGRGSRFQLEPVWVWNEFDYLDVNRHHSPAPFRTGPTPTPSSIPPTMEISSSPSVTKTGS